jgi:hypothetical protein
MDGWAAKAVFKNLLLGWEACLGFPPNFMLRRLK